jgi:hypothetical protein
MGLFGSLSRRRKPDQQSPKGSHTLSFTPEDWEGLRTQATELDLSISEYIGKIGRGELFPSREGKALLPKADYAVIDIADVRFASQKKEWEHGQYLADPTRVREVYLIQVNNSDHELYAITTFAKQRASLFQRGNMSLYSGGGGWLAAQCFRDWLVENGLLEKLNIIHTSDANTYETIRDRRIFDPAWIVPAQQEELIGIFESWKAGERVGEYWHRRFDKMLGAVDGRSEVDDNGLDATT